MVTLGIKWNKSSFGCHSPIHSTCLNFPFTARCIANTSQPPISMFAIYKSFFPPFQLLPIGFKLCYFLFFESMTLFFSLSFLLPAPKWKHWVVFERVSCIAQTTNCQRAVWPGSMEQILLKLTLQWIHGSPTKLAIITKITANLIHCQFSRLCS